MPELFIKDLILEASLLVMYPLNLFLNRICFGIFDFSARLKKL